MLITLTILAIWIFASFNYQTIRNLGHLPYNSGDLYYVLDPKGFIFTAVIFLEAVILACPVLYIPWTLSSPISVKIITWIAGVVSLLGIGMVSSVPEFKIPHTRYIIHFLGSGLGMIGTQIYVLLVFPWAFLGWIPVLTWKVLLAIQKDKRRISTWDKELLEGHDWMYFSEIGMAVTLYTALLAVLI